MSLAVLQFTNFFFLNMQENCTSLYQEEGQKSKRTNTKCRTHKNKKERHTPMNHSNTLHNTQQHTHPHEATTTLCWWRRQGHKLLSPFTPAIYQNLDSSLMFHKMEWEPVEVPSNTHPFLCFEIYQLSTIWICICDSNSQSIPSNQYDLVLHLWLCPTNEKVGMRSIQYTTIR